MEKVDSQDLFIGVDVGSGSVRSGLFAADGTLICVATKDIRIHSPDANYYEQSSVEIWKSVVNTVKEIIKRKPLENIRGIAFCATCSLVALTKSGDPVSINKNGDAEWNVMMWMDHRAAEEAVVINRTNHSVLQYVGGSISLEMQTPKMLWLKNNLPTQYSRTGHFLDLADFLRFKSTGLLSRSMCCVACKWTFVNTPTQCSWDETFFEKIGLTDALGKIGIEVSKPGDSANLCPSAAEELGLPEGIHVGFSLIDAHSGVLGMIACGQGRIDGSRLALISGTSNCHMALSKHSFQVSGVWGPYYGVISRSTYLSEGGQSAAGKLLDHIVQSHPAYLSLLEECKGSHKNVLINLEGLLNQEQNCYKLTKDLHVWPDFHGNRSPIGDPSLRGMISGLTLADSRQDLAVLYLATIQAIAHGSRHIKEAMESAGHRFKEMVICGGLAKSFIFLQMHADILQLPVLVPECSEPVLLGAAMSAAAAATKQQSNNDDSLFAVVQKMAGGCSVIAPDKISAAYHEKKHKVFLKMLEHQQNYKKIMNE